MFYRSGRPKTHLETQIPGLATLHHCRPTFQHQSRISLENWLKSNQIPKVKWWLMSLLFKCSRETVETLS